MPLGPGSSSQPETATVRLSIACLGAYVILDAVACLEPGVSVGDHWSALIAPGAVLGGIAWAYPGMRAGLRVFACLTLAFLATIAAGVSVAHATTEGLDAVDLAGFLLFAAAGALLAVGVLVGWQTRRADGHRYIRRTLIGVAGLVFAFEVLVPIGLAWIGTHRPAEPPDPADLGRPYTAVNVFTADGLDLTAWYVPSENGAAVITYPSRSGSDEQARMLADAGFGVLALDMRGYGESDGDPNAYGWASEPDLDAAVDFLARQPGVDPQRIGALGLSVGGEQVIDAAASDRDLRAVVSEGAGERSIRETLLFGAPAALVIPQQAILTAAVAVFSGDGVPPPLDDQAAAVAPNALFLISAENGGGGEELNDRYFDAARQPKEFWEIPGATHTGGIDTQPDEYRRRVLEFFDHNLPQR